MRRSTDDVGLDTALGPGRVFGTMPTTQTVVHYVASHWGFVLGHVAGQIPGHAACCGHDRCLVRFVTSQQGFPLWSSMGKPSSVYSVVNKEFIVPLLLNTALNVLFCIAMDSGDEAIAYLCGTFNLHEHDRGTKRTYLTLRRTLWTIQST